MASDEGGEWQKLIATIADLRERLAAAERDVERLSGENRLVTSTLEDQRRELRGLDKKTEQLAACRALLREVIAAYPNGCPKEWALLTSWLERAKEQCDGTSK